MLGTEHGSGIQLHECPCHRKKQRGLEIAFTQAEKVLQGKFFMGILSSLQNLSCGSKIYSVRGLSFWRAFLNHNNLPRGSSGPP